MRRASMVVLLAPLLIAVAGETEAIARPAAEPPASAEAAAASAERRGLEWGRFG